MTDVNQENPETKMDQSDSGGDSQQWLSQHEGLIGGLLIIGGAVVSLVMALKKVQKLAFWFIPVALYIGGIALVAEPLAQRHKKIEATQEEIISLLDQLDPVAKAQVAKHVAEAEFAKS